MSDAEHSPRAYRAWRRDRPRLQIAGVAVLALVLCARFPRAVLAPDPRPDERIYIAAAERVVAGESPYYGPYFYPPPLVFAGAGLIRLAGPGALVAAFRGFNVLGVALLVWWSLALLPCSFRRRLVAAALYLLIAPPVATGIVWGNLSLGIAGVVLLGLLLWPARPAVAGALLGASIAAKPVAPVAVLALLSLRAPPPGRPSERRPQRVAGTVALAVAVGLLLATPYLGELLATSARMPPFTRNVALYRALLCFGVAPPALGLFAAVAVLTMWWARRRARDPWQLLLIVIPASLLALPLVWSHTLILTLPIQVAALERAWRSLREPGENLRRRRLEALLVLVAVLALQLSEGVGGIDDRALWLQGLVILAPALAPLALSLYLLAPGAVAPAATSASSRCQRGITRGRS